MRALLPELPLLQGEDLHFNYRGRPILTGACIAIGAGEIVSLLGANGAGKSTLLRVLLGLLKPSRGEVWLGGAAMTTLSRREIAREVAYVPQVHVTPFPYTVREVVTLGRLPDAGMFRAPSAEDREIVSGVLQRLRITRLADRSYTEISGGERQLTLIARALAQQARVLVMDEPMTGLDYGYQVALAQHLGALAADGHAIVMSTHDPQFAFTASTRTALLVAGRIEADGAPETVITSDAIKLLYGVDVESHALPGGGRAFFPASHAGECAT